YLTLAKDPYNKEAFINIINKPFRYVSKTNLIYLRDYKEKINPFDILINKSDTPPFQKKKLEDLKNDFNYISKASLGSAIQYIIMDLAYIDYLKSYGERFNTSIDDLEDILEAFKESASAFKNIQDFFQHINNVSKKLAESKKNIQEGRVLLSTIHGVKGMEFKNVFIINCNEDTIPHISSKNSNLEEERRLFYVGITRAIDNLFLYSPKTRRGSFKEISRFIKEGGFNLEEKPEGLKVGGEINHKTYGLGVIEEAKGDDIKILFQDGTLRKFSLKVLIDNNLLVFINC
ncbi:MAG: ATP-dependent helicase, partial [Clostridiales bacterium]|nr:ATP-dependent helicase [Clostridiales bacterium]